MPKKTFKRNFFQNIFITQMFKIKFDCEENYDE